MTRQSPALFEALIRQKDHRDFLTEYFALQKGRGETLLAFSKRAGFSSAGFLSDVLKGKKNLSAKSLLAVKESLKVPSGLEQYFEYLVYQSRPALAPPHLKGERLTTQLRSLRSRLKERHEKKEPKAGKDSESLQEILGSFDAHVLFAALEPDRGVSRQDLQKRTGLGLAIIERGLQAFEKLGLVYEAAEGGLIHSHQENFENFGQEFNHSFQVTFQKALDLLQRKAADMNANQKDLFYYSAFLVREDTYEDLQRLLQNRLLQELDKSLPATGEKVAHLIFSMFLSESKN